MGGVGVRLGGMGWGGFFDKIKDRCKLAQNLNTSLLPPPSLDQCFFLTNTYKSHCPKKYEFGLDLLHLPPLWTKTNLEFFLFFQFDFKTQ